MDLLGWSPYTNTLSNHAWEYWVGSAATALQPNRPSMAGRVIRGDVAVEIQDAFGRLLLELLDFWKDIPFVIGPESNWTFQTLEQNTDQICEVGYATFVMAKPFGKPGVYDGKPAKSLRLYWQFHPEANLIPYVLKQNKKRKRGLFVPNVSFTRSPADKFLNLRVPHR